MIIEKRITTRDKYSTLHDARKQKSHEGNAVHYSMIEKEKPHETSTVHHMKLEKEKSNGANNALHDARKS